MTLTTAGAEASHKHYKGLLAVSQFLYVDWLTYGILELLAVRAVWLLAPVQSTSEQVGQFGTSYGASSWTNYAWVAMARVNNAISYATPAFAGITLYTRCIPIAALGIQAMT